MTLHPFNGRRTWDFWREATRESATFRLRSEPGQSVVDSPPRTGEVTLPASATEATEERPGLVPENQPPMALLEAALFLAKEPYSSRKLAQLAGLPEGTKIRQLVRELNKRYDQDQSAFCIVTVAEGFQLRTRPELAPWIVRMQGVPEAVRLSPPAMETLTVIAYRQPIPRAEVERIRGVQCGDLIRQLLDQDLAKIIGRSEDLGRPFLYGTTTKFLQVFGLDTLNDLPVLEELAS
jgi:segregation and condensation protein B